MASPKGLSLILRRIRAARQLHIQFACEIDAGEADIASSGGQLQCLCIFALRIQEHFDLTRAGHQK